MHVVYLEYALDANAQQSSQAPSPEQEFLDAIKKGNSARVGEHKATHRPRRYSRLTHS
ncbi:MAG: hypothetical protein ABI923_03215 [bacterium]